MTRKSTTKPAPPTPVNARTATCAQCGTQFEPTTYWQRFCSLKCRNEYQYQITKRGRQLAIEEMKKAGNQ